MSTFFVTRRALENVMRRGVLKVFDKIPSRNDIYHGVMVPESKEALPVIWKPESGEHDERPCILGQFYLREVAAYEISKCFGENNVHVPETIKYSLNNQVGSVQRELQNAIIGDYINMDYMICVNLDQWRWAAMFDYVIGNNDRHSGNWMCDRFGTLWLIDNGSSFPYKNDCWRGSLQVLRPMINRGVEIHKWMKDIILENVKVMIMVLEGLGMTDAVAPMVSRVEMLTSVEKFSDLVIKR